MLLFAVLRGGAFNANYSRQLLKAIGRVYGLVTSDEEVADWLCKLMLDRDEGMKKLGGAGSRQIIVAANEEEIDSSKREEREFRRIKTRSPIVVILYNLVDILSRRRRSLPRC
jgi:hypothetical protein